MTKSVDLDVTKGGRVQSVDVLPELLLETREYIYGTRADIVKRFKKKYGAEYKEPAEIFLSNKTGKALNKRSVSNLLRKVFDASQGVAPIAPGDSSLFYTNARGEQQQLDPAFHDEAQLRSAAAAQGWTLTRSGLGGNNLTVTSPAGVVYQVVPDLRVDVLGADNGLSGVIRQEGGKLYFYYADEPLRQGFMLK